MISGETAPHGPLRSHITGGYKGIQTRSSRSDLDCNQFSSDYDVLYHFSFLIMINPINNDWLKSTAYMNENGTLVRNLRLLDEGIVPLSIFCLQNLQSLTINNMAFPNGIVSDDLGDLKQLNQLAIFNSPIIKMTERLGTLNTLSILYLQNCSLTYLPDLSGIPQLFNVNLNENQLSKVNGLTGVYNLDISNNLFTDIPTLNTANRLEYLVMNNNPLTNMLTITSHVKLQTLYLNNTTLSSIPATIDRLQQLKYLVLSNNKLFYLPTNMLSLANLQHLNIQNNLFSSADIQAFRTRFNNSLPSMTLIS